MAQNLHYTNVFIATPAQIYPSLEIHFNYRTKARVCLSACH